MREVESNTRLDRRKGKRAVSTDPTPNGHLNVFKPANILQKNRQGRVN